MDDTSVTTEAAAKKKDTRSRGWVFTVNNPIEADHAAIQGLMTHTISTTLGVTYAVAGKEVGEEGTPHYQGFIYFKDKKSLKQVKAILPRAHLEAQKGTAEQAATYCKKDGKFQEVGTVPMTQQEKGQKGKEAIKARWQAAIEGDFMNLPPEQIKTYEYIYHKNQKVYDLDKLDNLWIHGASGLGKSRYIRKHWGSDEFFSKPMSKWWDGYDGQKIVILDDFDPRHAVFLSYFLKIWADYYTFNAEVKGGMLQIRPERIIVTSQYPMERCFTEPEDLAAISRRFKVLNLATYDWAAEEATAVATTAPTAPTFEAVEQAAAADVDACFK